MDRSSVMEKVLLLNATYEPLRIISWRRAVTLSILGKAEVLEEYPREIHGVSLTLRLPAVVRLVQFILYRPPAVSFTRTNIFIRDHFRCQYCGKQFRPEDLSLDHVVPLWRGGRKCWENIVTCCIDCNRKKGGRTLAQSGMQLISTPARPEHRMLWGYNIQFLLQHEPWRGYLTNSIAGELGQIRTFSPLSLSVDSHGDHRA